MEKVFKEYKPFKRILIIVLSVITTFQANGQLIKPAESAYVPVNGIKVYYEVYGAGKPIVLIHGAFMSIDGNWGELIPELSKTRKVIAIELQGHGHTPYADRKLDIVTLADDVYGVMNYLKVDSVDIAGYSMGGSVAYQLTIQHPRQVRRLVILSSTYKSTGWLPVINTGFKNVKPEIFDNTPIKAAYEAVAPDKTKWTRFVEQMFAFADDPLTVATKILQRFHRRY